MQACPRWYLKEEERIPAKYWEGGDGVPPASPGPV